MQGRVLMRHFSILQQRRQEMFVLALSARSLPAHRELKLLIPEVLLTLILPLPAQVFHSDQLVILIPVETYCILLIAVLQTPFPLMEETMQ